jgi:peroxiredoxin Q/BCP
MTLQCTVEACSLRDNLPSFPDSEFAILGISADSVASHKKFAEKHKLPFTLLADEDKSTVKEYDVWHPKKFMGREFMGVLRTSFLINPKAEIVKIYEKVNPMKHTQEVLEDFRTMK